MSNKPTRPNARPNQGNNDDVPVIAVACAWTSEGVGSGDGEKTGVGLCAGVAATVGDDTVVGVVGGVVTMEVIGGSVSAPGLGVAEGAGSSSLVTTATTPSAIDTTHANTSPKTRPARLPTA